MDSCGSSLSGKVYKEARRLGVGHCCYKMGGILGKVKEEKPEIDVYDISFEEEASTSEARETDNSDQSTGLDPEQIQKLLKKVQATLEQNPNRKKNRKSTILVFYYHSRNKKKNENGPMEDEETAEESSNTSPDNSPSKPLCPPGAQDAEPSALTPAETMAEESFVEGSNVQRRSPLDRPNYSDGDD